MKSVSAPTIHTHGRLKMDLKTGDKVRNIFTKEIGTVVEVHGEDVLVCYNSFWFDMQKRRWVKPVRRYVN
jgi:co-chaperonin GroES (HSP10)